MVCVENTLGSQHHGSAYRAPAIYCCADRSLFNSDLGEVQDTELGVERAGEEQEAEEQSAGQEGALRSGPEPQQGNLWMG